MAKRKIVKEVFNKETGSTFIAEKVKVPDLKKRIFKTYLFNSKGKCIISGKLTISESGIKKDNNE